MIFCRGGGRSTTAVYSGPLAPAPTGGLGFFLFFFVYVMFIAIFHLQVKLVTKLYIKTTLLYITDAKFDYYRLS